MESCNHASLVLLSSCASFLEEADHFQFAAMSPLRDLNLTQAPILGQFNALYQPYDYADHDGCRVGFRSDSDTFVDRSGNLRDVGVKSATSKLISFRGVVRQISGASHFKQQANRASDQARYRIGYLVGLARSHRCPGFGTLNEAPQIAASPQYDRARQR